MLQKHLKFKVIGEVSDGLEAVQQAQQLQPDLILLDIGLPSLNGIEAARRIRQVSPASKILFASENHSQDIVEEALGTGAGGYVLKSDAASELLPAIDDVLRGRQLVSTSLKDHDSIDNADADKLERVVAPSPLQSVDCHDLRLFANDRAFVDGLARSIEAALRNGNASVVIVSESHRSDLLQKLRADGVNVGAAVERGYLNLLDVADSLSSVMVEGAADENHSVASARMPEVIMEVVRTTKERHLHLAVG
jgi:CheY-like chemotaxis protein